MKRTDRLIHFSVAMLLALLLAIIYATSAHADDVQIWQVTFTNPFNMYTHALPSPGTAGTCQNFGTQHQPARGAYKLRAHYHVANVSSDDEVWVYRIDDNDEEFRDWSIAYATSEATCNQIKSGALPLDPPPQ